MSVTIEDVALRANLNKGSVSRILNGKGGGYSIDTQKRVMETAAAMGYQPNALARALGTGQTNTIAFWFQSPTYYSPYFGYLQHCIQRLGAKHGYQMLTEMVPQLNSKDPNGSKMVNWPVDGILCGYMTPSAANHLLSLVKRHCPIVCIQQSDSPDLERYSNVDYVNADFYSGAKEVMEHLLGEGCQRIAFMSMPHMMNDPRARVYREMMGKASRKIEFIATPEESRRAVSQVMKEYIAQHGCSDGIFCNNDELAIGCCLALRELGIRVPDDVLLVGFDGLDNARYFNPPISSVSIPLEEMCNLAWDLLRERIQNPDLPTRRETFATRLQIRESSQRYAENLLIPSL